MTNFMRMLAGDVSVSVFKSDAVIWWATIFRTVRTLCGGLAGVNDPVFEFAFGKNNAVTAFEMRSGSHPARRPTLNVHGSLGHFCGFNDGIEGAGAATAATTGEKGESIVSREVTVHRTIVPDEQSHILLHWSLVAIPSQAPPTSAINLDLPELKQTMFCFLEDAYTGYHVCPTVPLTQTAILEWLRRSLTSPT